MTRLWGWIVVGVRFEINLYVALGRWLLRRPAVPVGATPWGYARLVTPVIWLWIFGSAVEVVVVHVVTPWLAVRLVLLAVGVWGLLWMVGLLASYRVYPHLVDGDGLRVRHGKRADVRVPWERVARVTTVDRDLPSSVRTFQPRPVDGVDGEGGVDLQIGVSGRANVHLVLTEPMTVPVSGEPLAVTALTFLVDDPREFVAQVRSAVRSAAH